MICKSKCFLQKLVNLSVQVYLQLSNALKKKVVISSQNFQHPL